jgi:TonB family protein
MSFQSLGQSMLPRALALSLIAHLALLWPTVADRPAPNVPSVLFAHLRGGSVDAGGKAAPPRAATKTRLELPATGRPATSVSTASGASRSLTAGRTGNEDAEALRGYRLSLARTAAAYRHYPQQAIDDSWQGSVEILVDVAAAGTATRVLTSSGRLKVDAAAEEMIRHALPDTPMPNDLVGRTFSFVLPIVFESAE